MIIDSDQLIHSWFGIVSDGTFLLYKLKTIPLRETDQLAEFHTRGLPLHEHGDVCSVRAFYPMIVGWVFMIQYLVPWSRSEGR